MGYGGWTNDRSNGNEGTRDPPSQPHFVLDSLKRFVSALVSQPDGIENPTGGWWDPDSDLYESDGRVGTFP